MFVFAPMLLDDIKWDIMSCLSCRGSLFEPSVRLRERRAPSPPWRREWGCFSRRDLEWSRTSAFILEEWDRPQWVLPKPAQLSSRGQWDIYRSMFPLHPFHPVFFYPLHSLLLIGLYFKLLFPNSWCMCETESTFSFNTATWKPHFSGFPLSFPQAMGRWSPQPGLWRPPGWVGPSSLDPRRESGVPALTDSQLPLQV